MSVLPLVRRSGLAIGVPATTSAPSSTASTYPLGTEIGTVSHTFGDVGRGALLAFVGSGGTVEIAVRDGSAARLLGVGVGAEVRA